MNVIFLVFNRPELTRRVFAEIARARPKKLLVVADGPRTHVAGEAERCRLTREIATRVDWDCEVLTDFSEVNLGCKRRVASGLSWAFSQVEEAIVLEDDCLPSPSFFRFCTEMLERYRDDPRVMSISGNCFDERFARRDESYYFSKINHIWGWASWRRAWNRFDVSMASWPEFRDQGGLKRLGWGFLDRHYWTQIFDRTHAGLIDTWDYQWTYAVIRGDEFSSGLSINPRVNLVTNLGFGADATHTTVANAFADLPSHELEFPLAHPREVRPELAADQRYMRRRRSFLRRAWGRVLGIFKI